MALQSVLGMDSPVETNRIIDKSEKMGVTVVVEGRYSHLLEVVPSAYSPGDTFSFENSHLTANGDGTGRLEIKFHDSGNSDWASTRTTYRVDMAEVSYELQDHPDLQGKETHLEIESWLAMDPGKRTDENGNYQYLDRNGVLQPVGDAGALKFCAAYDAGIKTFLRFYPVIEKISYWKRPPGMSVDVSTGSASGDPAFTSVGSFETPPLNLNGYNDENWFKSKDSWFQGSDQKWTRTEQWTFTPEGSNSEYGWIYTGSSAS